MDNTGFVFATKIEAKPFIEGLGLKQIEKDPFNIYLNDRLYLIIGGISKVNSAVAASYLIWKYGIKIIFNIGACGATTTDKTVGNIFHVDKVIEYDRPKLATGGIRISAPDIFPQFSKASLATQDKPVVTQDERAAVSKHADLVDMEGAAVVQACRLWGAKCYLFKIVTDTPEHEEDEIINNVISTAEKMFKFIKSEVLIHIE